MKHKDLKQALNQPPIPSTLEQQIRQNWQEQLQPRKKPLGLRVAVALIALMTLTALVTLSLPWIQQSDNLLHLAMTDIEKDQHRHTGIHILPQTLRQQTGIHLPASMKLEMSKRCKLKNDDTLHIKVSGTQGSAHFFIKQEGFDATLPDPQSTQNTVWKIIKSRSGQTVLVLSRDMHPGAVDQLIQTMFYT